MCVHCYQMRYLFSDLLDSYINRSRDFNVLLISFVFNDFTTIVLRYWSVDLMDVLDFYEGNLPRCYKDKIAR